MKRRKVKKGKSAESGRGGVKQLFIMMFSALLLALSFLENPASAEDYPVLPPPQNWSFNGIFGTYDKAQLQRGLKIYTEICSSCHGLRFVALRDLQALGYSLADIREFAAKFEYKTVDGSGKAALRKGAIQDYFPDPYENEIAAANANNGAIPPDLSLMARARAADTRPFAFITDLLTHYDSGGADYIAALLTGYREPPPNLSVPSGQYYNPYFAFGDTLAMAPALHDGMIHYDDGSPQTARQYALDVAAFLNWTADPHREIRHKTGFFVSIFLLISAALLYLLKREIWAKK